MKKTVRTVQMFWEEESLVTVSRHQTVANYANDSVEPTSQPDKMPEDAEKLARRTEGENNEE